MPDKKKREQLKTVTAAELEARATTNEDHPDAAQIVTSDESVAAAAQGLKPSDILKMSAEDRAKLVADANASAETDAPSSSAAAQAADAPAGQKKAATKKKAAPRSKAKKKAAAKPVDKADAAAPPATPPTPSPAQGGSAV